MFNQIDSVNIQGLSSSDYSEVVDLLSNPDEYDYSWIVLPGITYQNGSGVLSTLMANCENRGDTMAVVDMVNYGAPISAVDSAANSYDSSYGATYWPWVQVLSQETGKLVFVPASTVMCGVYAYNDKVAETWFAPAGFNRGGLSGVIQAERKLSPSDRDNLYINKVNPLATFPGQGVVAFGQKTLQTKASALDRVNVRRLLITLKRYIGNIADNLVFEQNTATTRNKFLNQVNPYLENVQQKQGLYSYKVVMDESNNTAETIDRNQLVGAIYLQPTKTAEFIILDFNITPTGVQFA
jgi:phage tail sheath protein FI